MLNNEATDTTTADFLIVKAAVRDSIYKVAPEKYMIDEAEEYLSIHRSPKYWYTDEELKLITIEGPFTDIGVAIKKANRLNRRVDINIVKKGY